MRRKYPFMGKARIHAMLARKRGHLSVSTVGRIIERTLAAGAIRPDRTGRPRRSATGLSSRAGQAQAAAQHPEGAAFAALATRWKSGSKARRPGELVQIDHMTYACGGQTLKEFRAVCPVSKFTVTRVYSRATAGRMPRAKARTPRAKARTLPDGPPRRTAVPAAVRAGRRRQRVHGRVRGRLRGTVHAPARPAAPEAPMERLPPRGGCDRRWS